MFFDENGEPKLVANARGKTRNPGAKPLSDLMEKCEDKDFVDFIDKCVEWGADKRLTPENAIKHPWIIAGLEEIRVKTSEDQ